MSKPKVFCPYIMFFCEGIRLKPLCQLILNNFLTYFQVEENLLQIECLRNGNFELKAQILRGEVVILSKLTP